MRFPEFKGEWDEILIGDKFDFFSTNSLSRAKLDEESGEILNIHYGDIHTKFPSIVNVKKVRIPFVSEEVDTNKINKYELCKNGDILIADASEDYADIGKTIELQGITYEKIIGGLHTLLLRDKTTNVSPLFNGYLFQNEKLKKQIKIKANGISVLGISKKELQKISIKIPSIEEQKKISNLLFAIDQKLSFMEKNISNRKIIRKFYINKFYSEKKDTTNFLEDFIKQLNIKNKTNEEYDVLSINNKKGFVKQKDQFGEHEVASSDKHNYKIINNGNYAYNPARINVGSIARLDEFENGIISPMYIMFNINNKRLLSDYLKFYFESETFKYNMLKRLEGSVRQTLSFDALKNIPLFVPNTESQDKISKFLKIYDIEINLLEQKLSTNKKYKQSLLSKLFC